VVSNQLLSLWDTTLTCQYQRNLSFSGRQKRKQKAGTEQTPLLQKREWFMELNNELFISGASSNCSNRGKLVGWLGYGVMSGVRRI